MSDTQVAALDHTIQRTNIWLKTLAESLHFDERHHAYSGLRAVPHVLRDRVTPVHAVHLRRSSRFLSEGFITKIGASPKNQQTSASRPSSRPSLPPNCPLGSHATR